MNPRVVRCFSLGLLGLLLPLRTGHAAAVVLELEPPQLCAAFADSVQIQVYALSGYAASAIDDLVQGRARLEIIRSADASPQEFSAAIICPAEGPHWETLLVEAIPSTRLLGAGTAYFQMTANLVEYGALCADETPLKVVVWAAPVEGQDDPAGSIVNARLIYNSGESE